MRVPADAKGLWPIGAVTGRMGRAVQRLDAVISSLVQADQERIAGPHPDRTPHASCAAVSDPDGNGGNGRLLQEITERLPGR
ncbi:hypothetical protein SY2F82_31440 [Streptomyces sp. Y2F8-2]|uniref:hypothetical protein n=1 Tax=unclassified Streptomyces TaxID=2593676 RepID=UPI001904114E|nr:hypothetical protein [Streptomyces sp. Y2F8-2]GHK01347.1 hypothetical protein SY2F82_31440 [Streptomyces sp. Y2F8-2]